MAASIPLQSAQRASAFEKDLRSSIQQFKVYEVESNRRQALARVPLADLEAIAQAKYESSEKPLNISSEKEKSIVRDMLLLELMDWFKNDFFTWMDSPPCPNCRRPTTGIGSGVPTALEMSMSAGRVEIFTCTSCSPDRREVARFPRYNNPVVLLDTKTGRCGEWANCFALICRAAGFEVRHVRDYTDHVWVEVYSESLTPNRWVHADPCENAYDKPLLYETGWGKKLTYIIAVSNDDIQDVTPRYTKDMGKILPRRRDVDEAWLASSIIKLRKEMQRNLAENRRTELFQRWAREIAEFLKTKSDGDVKPGEDVGRESGSLAWRLARQETGSVNSSTEQTGFIWKVGEKTVQDGKFELNYSPSLDVYFRKTASGENDRLKTGWRSGIWHEKNVFRKEERDWKMVYLATTENSMEKGSQLSWKFEIDPGYTLEQVEIRVKYSIFQADAKFTVKLGGDGESRHTLLETNSGDQMYSWSSKTLPEEKFKSVLGGKTIVVDCEMKCGSGNEGWQKVQLFRQSLSGSSFDTNIFQILFHVKKSN